MNHSAIFTTLGILTATSICADAALTARDYMSNGTDFSGVDVSGAFIWGMDANPINNVGTVDVDGNGTKDFHESGSSPVDPSDGLASNSAKPASIDGSRANGS